MKTTCCLIKIVSICHLIMLSSLTLAQVSINAIEEPVEYPLAVDVCGEHEVIKIDNYFACKHQCPSYACIADVNESFQLKAMIPGHFSSKEYEEIVIDTEGCEPHVNNFGGLLLLRKNNDLWQRVYYQPGFRLNECLKFSSVNKPDMLVCNEVYTAQGQTIGQFALLRFGRKKIKWNVLQSWVTDNESLFRIEPVSAIQKDLNTDGLQDLSLVFTINIPEQPSREVHLDFLFTGKTAKISDNTKAEKATLDSLLTPYLETK